MVALRQILRNPVYSIINIFGFAIGLAVCLMITLYVVDDLTFDHFHKDTANIHRLLTYDKDEAVGGLKYAITSGPLAVAIGENIPEVVATTRITSFGRFPVRRADVEAPDDGSADITRISLVTDKQFFEVFDAVQILEGDRETIFESPDEILLTHETAELLFGEEEAIGQLVNVGGPQPEKRVTGIVSKPPRNSHIQFDLILPLIAEQNPIWWDSWENLMLQAYVRVQDGSNIPDIERRIVDLAEANNFADVFTPGLQPLMDVHLGSNQLKYDRTNFGKNDRKAVYALGVIAILVLLIASINFINLSSARATKRAREVGMRKVVGAGKSQLIGQFLGESVITTFIAMIIAIILAQLLLPSMGTFLNKELDFNLINHPFILMTLILSSVLVGLIAGAYPAMVLSGFLPIKVLKGEFKTSQQGVLFRRVLVIGQFAISIALVVGVLIVLNQINYLQNLNMGYNRDQVVVIPTFNQEVGAQRDVLADRLDALPGVNSVGSAWQLPGLANDLIRIEVIPEASVDPDKGMMFDQFFMDQDFFKTAEISIVKGRNFSHEFGSDSGQVVLINETAARELGWENPIGKELDLIDQDESRNTRKIIGVLKDVHFTSLRQKVAPMVVRYSPQRCGWVLARLAGGEVDATQEEITAIWTEMFPESQLNSRFYDEFFEFQFAGDRNFATKIGVFSGLAILIACLGLFGLASFSTEQRRKEIAVRKVLGASESSIVKLLVLDFLRWVLIANIVAWPLGWWGMSLYLKDFAYQMPFTPWPFIIAGSGAAIIAAVTVALQSIRASRTNPVNAISSDA